MFFSHLAMTVAEKVRSSMSSRLHAEVDLIGVGGLDVAVDEVEGRGPRRRGVVDGPIRIEIGPERGPSVGIGVVVEEHDERGVVPAVVGAEDGLAVAERVKAQAEAGRERVEGHGLQPLLVDPLVRALLLLRRIGALGIVVADADVEGQVLDRGPGVLGEDAGLDQLVLDVLFLADPGPQRDAFPELNVDGLESRGEDALTKWESG